MTVRVFVHGDEEIAIVGLSRALIAGKHNCTLSDSLEASDVAIAPLLTRKLDIDEVNAPKYGTLIFHPSLLPRHRGRDAIKWAFYEGEKYSGATWFWADSGLDTGDICDMEVIAIDEEETPRDFYNFKVIPAALRMLFHITDEINAGYIRRRPQMHQYATYESPFKKNK